jgi:membrane fusion protein (multidrug efflux system)
MPAAFSRTLRSLHADHFRTSLWCIAGVVVLMCAGGAWFFCARVELYETARNARLEVEREVHPVAALLPGRVTKTSLAVGRRVEAGELLVELDTESENLRVGEERSRLNALSRRREALQNEISAEEGAGREEQKTARLATDEARARHQEAEAAQKFAEGEAKRVAELGALVPKSELLKGQSEAEQKRAAVSALSASINRLDAEVQSKAKAHEARVAKLKSEAAALDGEVETSQAAIKRYAYEIEKRLVRAPIAGQLGEVADLRIGSFVNGGEKLATVVPDGRLKAVAHFPPLTALGRVRAGQLARLRLDGFPWTQYGSLAGKVVNVANEPRDGTIRVELSVDPASAPAIPVQHGLPGTVEIQVERVTPFALVLRAAGKAITGHGDSLKMTRDGGSR